MTLSWPLSNFVSPIHVSMVTAPVILYWGLCLFYSLTVPTQGSLPRPAYQIVRRVLIQQAIQVVVTVAPMPEDVTVDWSADGLMWSAFKFIVCLVIFDTYEYWMHRWMHVNTWLYKNVHSVHHQLLDNRPYAALYNHWLEALLMDSVGSVIAMTISNLEPFWFSVFGCLATLKTVHDHVGVEPSKFDPFYLIFGNNAPYHAVHHRLAGRKLNFSQPFLTIWDDLMGTKADPKKFDQEPRVSKVSDSKILKGSK